MTCEVRLIAVVLSHVLLLVGDDVVESVVVFFFGLRLVVTEL